MMTPLPLLLTIMITVGDNVVMGADFKNVKAVTYNTALLDVTLDPEAVIPNNRLERRAKMIEIFNSSEADLLCLQEVWIGEDVEAIVDGVKSNYPYSFSSIHKGRKVDGYRRPKEGPVCDVTTLTTLMTCVETKGCLNSEKFEDSLGCIFVSCAIALQSYIFSSSEQCVLCVITAFPSTEIMIKECGGVGQDRKTQRKMNTNGLMLLSKSKLRKARSVDIFPSIKLLLVRGYLSAKVSGLQTVCTHLTTEGPTTYPEIYLQAAYNFTSYSDQKAFEVNHVINTFGAYKRILLLGDFNTGPDSFPDSYDALVAVFSTKLLKLCTFCNNATNPYNYEVNEGTIDHVFGKGIDIRRVDRVYTQIDYSVQYNSRDLPLSDHFGVEARILPQ